MKVRSIEIPEAFEILKSGHTVTIAFRYDISEIEVDEDVHYEYDEIFLETKNMPNLEASLSENYDEWLNKALVANGLDTFSVATAKKDELNQQCKDNIIGGFVVDLGTGEKHFGCSIENQSNIDNLYLSAMMVAQGMMLPEGTSLEYNTSEDECLSGLTVEQVTMLWVAKNTHVYKHRKECELLKKAVDDGLIN